tara:strand:- start:1102 stop:1407 length:306 start_codon:yes stop_codon:yes gene_type:complete
MSIQLHIGECRRKIQNEYKINISSGLVVVITVVVAVVIVIAIIIIIIVAVCFFLYIDHLRFTFAPLSRWPFEPVHAHGRLPIYEIGTLENGRMCQPAILFS